MTIHYPMRTSDILIELRPAKDSEPAIYRTISERIIAGKIRVPAAQADVTDAWRKLVSFLLFGPGDVSPPFTNALDLAPEAPGLFENISRFIVKHGLPKLTASTPIDVLGCRGAPFHHDMEDYASSVFCVVWLEKSRGLDLVFPDRGQRIPLQLGTIVIFDAGQPHGVIQSDLRTFFPPDYEELSAQTYLSVNFDALSDSVIRVMDIETTAAVPIKGARFISKAGARPKVNLETGRWE